MVTCLNIKQNIGHAWFLRLHILSKLIFLITCLNIKQNIGHTWFLGPHTFSKLIFLVTCLNNKQNLDHAWFLGLHVLSKITLRNFTKDGTLAYASSLENEDSPWVLVKGF